MKKKKAKTKNPKEKGNRNERKIAVEMSEWMFGDKSILFRDASSGARKVAYVGDIVPVKQMPWKYFPWFIEAKSGYNKDIATFYNQKLLREWIVKYTSQLTEEQSNLLLVIRHDHKQPFVICNKELTLLDWTLCIKVNEKKYYSYLYKDLLEVDINDLLNDLSVKDILYN
jgi:hypothetical protein